jgi:hypothetical protein
LSKHDSKNQNLLVSSTCSERGLQTRISDQPVRGDVIRNAFGFIASFDPDLHRPTITFLESEGISLDKWHYYSLRQIDKQLRNYFGAALTALLVVKIEKDVRRQYYGNRDVMQLD